ncbi:MAG: N-acetyltransferase [Phycisphaeraceae bacterium]|nr:N-acetyltransferase [Phycisphaeraceae bacterium]
MQRVIRSAFGGTEGEVVATLVDDLLADPTALPYLSLVATVRDRIVGHVLFTAVTLQPRTEHAPASILAPLAVHPDFQNRRIGGMLIAEGLNRLRERGVRLVFVLGGPGYYQRHGFSPAGKLGYAAPHPIPPEYTDAWMVQALSPGTVRHTPARVQCARTLADPKHWLA